MAYFNSKVIDLPADGSKFCITTDCVNTHNVAGLRLIVYSKNGLQNELSGGTTKLIQANVSEAFPTNVRHAC